MTTDHRIDPRFRTKPHGNYIDINQLYCYREQLGIIRDADSKRAKACQDLLNRIDALLNDLDNPMRVVVAGGFNAGKSTFLNALVNQRIMPMGATRSTCTVNVLQGGTRRELIIQWRNGRHGRHEYRSYQNDADAQQQIDALMKTEHHSIAQIAVCCPNQPFLERFTLIDTPGLDHNAQDSAASAAEVQRADALIWVLHSKGAEKLDYEQIVQFRTANPDSPVIVILNQVDALEEDELHDALTATQNKLNAHVTAVLPLSAKLASEGQAKKDHTKLDASHFYDLRNYLQHHLFDQYRTLQEKIRFQRRSQPLIAELQRFIKEVTAQQQPAASHFVEQQVLNESNSVLPTTDDSSVEWFFFIGMIVGGVIGYGIGDNLGSFIGIIIGGLIGVGGGLLVLDILGNTVGKIVAVLLVLGLLMLVGFIKGQS